MNIQKQEVLTLLEKLPDTIDVEELIYRLYLYEKRAASEQAIAEGRTLTSDEVRAQVASWRK